jgi:PAS domain S-box-containing protein
VRIKMASKVIENETALHRDYPRLTEEEIAIVREVRPIVMDHLDELVDGFYSHLLHYEEGKKTLGGESELDKFKEVQRRYLASLFSGDYGPEYMESRMRIGETHYKMGLGIGWYLGVVHRYEWLLLDLIRKYSQLDIDKLLKLGRTICAILLSDTRWVLEAYELAHTRELRGRLEELQIEQQACESLHECIILTDLNRKILRANPSCLPITGYKPDELVGHSLKLLNSSENPLYLIEEMRTALVKKGAWSGEILCRRKDDTLWDCHLYIRIFKDLAGIPRGYLVIMGDITEEKRRMRLLEQNSRDMNNLSTRLQEQFVDTISMFAAACEAKDEVTGNHVNRIRNYSVAIARELGLTEEMANEIGVSSILHDVGKIHIPDNILKKPGPLNPDEWELMKTHTCAGEKILYAESFQMARNIAMYHHENWNGTGYPRGLKGAEIPIEARIAKVADVFDALTSKRPYKPAFSEEKALQEVCTMRSKRQIDPLVTEAFISNHRKGMISEIRQRYADKNYGPGAGD